MAVEIAGPLSNSASQSVLFSQHSDRDQVGWNRACWTPDKTRRSLGALVASQQNWPPKVQSTGLRIVQAVVARIIRVSQAVNVFLNVDRHPGSEKVFQRRASSEPSPEIV